MKFLTTFASALVLCSLLAYPHVNAQSSDHHASHDLTRERAVHSNAHPSESAAPKTAAPKTAAPKTASSKRAAGVAKRPVQEAPKEVEGEEEEQPAKKTTGKRSTGKSKKEEPVEEEVAAKKSTGKRSTGKSKKEAAPEEEEEEEAAKKTTGKRSTGKSTGAPGAGKVTSPHSRETHPGETNRESGKVNTGKNPSLPKKSNPPPVEAKKGETHPPVAKKGESHPPAAKKGESPKNPPAAKKEVEAKNPPAAKKGEEAKKAVTKKPISKRPLVPSGRLEVQKCASSSNEYLDLKWVRASPFPLTVKSPLNLRIHGNFPKGLERGSKLDIIAKVLFFSQTVTLDICEELEISKAKVKCPLTPGNHTLLLTVPQDKLKPFNIDIQAKAKDPKGRDLFCFNTVMSFKA